MPQDPTGGAYSTPQHAQLDFRGLLLRDWDGKGKSGEGGEEFTIKKIVTAPLTLALIEAGENGRTDNVVDSKQKDILFNNYMK